MNIRIYPGSLMSDEDRKHFWNAIATLEEKGWRHLLLALTDEGVLLGSPTDESIKWANKMANKKQPRVTELEDRLMGLGLEPHIRNEIVDRILK